MIGAQADWWGYPETVFPWDGKTIMDKGWKWWYDDRGAEPNLGYEQVFSLI